MQLTVILAVSVDSSFFIGLQRSAWQSAGFIFMSVNSIREAIDHFQVGDFDVVLLGPSISVESRERLTHLIRAHGSRTPVICMADYFNDCDDSADATLGNAQMELLRRISLAIECAAECSSISRKKLALRKELQC
jgi:DNA-binding NtrC family response regulator